MLRLPLLVRKTVTSLSKRGALLLTPLLLVCSLGPVFGQEPSTSPLATESAEIHVARVQFVQAEMHSHFAYTDIAPGQVVERDLVYKTANRFRFNLRSNGGTFLETRVESGSSFGNPYNSTGLGSDERFRLNVKSIYLRHNFGSDFQVEAGGLDYDFGAGTDIAYAAGDGWLTGYRWRILNSESRSAWRPDRITATAGYIGDFTRPNFFSRAYRMADVNYLQLLAYKRFGEHFQGAVEWDRIAAVTFTRQSLRYSRLRSRLLDSAMMETTVRASSGADLAWGATLANTLDSQNRWHTGVMVSSVPLRVFSQNNQQFLLNWGEAGLGKRGGFQLRFLPTSNMEFGGLVTRKLDSTPGVARWRALIFAKYEFADLINPAFRFIR